MEIKLIDGVFTIEEAEYLLNAIFNIKIAFHEQKIRTIHQSEEDIAHSEKRIIQLQDTLRNAVCKMRQKGQTHTNLNAHIEVNTMQPVTQ